MKIHRPAYWFAFTLGLSLLSRQTLMADAIVSTKAMSASTIAEYFVEDDSVRVVLEIGSADAPAFKNLFPDEIYQHYSPGDTTPVEQRLAKFFAEDFSIQADGVRLVGQVKQLSARDRVVRDEITGQPLAVQPDAPEKVIHAELEYDFSGKPTTITLVPTMDAQREHATANIGFITYHRTLPVMEFRYLAAAETLELDWEDPWYSKFRNRNLRRQYEAPLSVFLYVEPFEVRVEVVARPVDIQRWTDLGVKPGKMISVESQPGIKSRVVDFLEKQIDVEIDGKPAQGKADRIHFIRRTLRKTGVVYPDEALDGSSATLGVIYVYPTQQLPGSVRMKWALFDDRINTIPATATDEAGGLGSKLTPEDPVLEWKNYLTNPSVPAMLAIESPPARPQLVLPLASLALIVVAVVLSWNLFKPRARSTTIVAATGMVLAFAGAYALRSNMTLSMTNPLVAQRQVTEDQAGEVTCSLMHNLYRSFDRRDESIVYDQLSTCVSGELLRDIYIQIMKRIRLEDQGGAKVKVNEVEVLTTEFVFREDSPGFQSNVKWNVIGSVGHWGHLHQRANQYQAEFNIEPVDQVWKIVSMQITDEVNLANESIQ